MSNPVCENCLKTFPTLPEIAEIEYPASYYFLIRGKDNGVNKLKALCQLCTKRYKKDIPDMKNSEEITKEQYLNYQAFI